jgi:hypothetical protein
MNSPEVTVTCQDNRTVRVRFHDRSRPDRDDVRYAVEIAAPGMNARAEGVNAWVWDAGLARFLAELAADFRGWEGERAWRTDDRDLAVTAVFRSGGHVGLTWTLRPWRRDAASWSASVTTWLEAGEQLAALAADVREFLTAGERTAEVAAPARRDR